MKGMLANPNRPAPLPVVCVQTRKSPAVCHLLAALALLGAGVWFSQRDEIAPLLGAAISLGSVVYVAYAAALLFDRRPRVVFRADAVELVICRSGLIRYQEIVHVECFRVQSQAAVAVFLTPEAHARLPAGSADNRTPVFANELFSSPPLWFVDGSLTATAPEIAAELDARRRGATGPLTARQLARR